MHTFSLESTRHKRTTKGPQTLTDTARSTPAPVRNGGRVLESWENIIFLVHEPNRKGKLTYYVRVIIGDIAPHRWGPFESGKQARKLYPALIDQFAWQLRDVLLSFQDVGSGQVGLFHEED